MHFSTSDRFCYSYLFTSISVHEGIGGQIQDNPWRWLGDRNGRGVFFEIVRVFREILTVLAFILFPEQHCWRISAWNEHRPVASMFKRTSYRPAKKKKATFTSTYSYWRVIFSNVQVYLTIKLETKYCYPSNFKFFDQNLIDTCQLMWLTEIESSCSSSYRNRQHRKTPTFILRDRISQCQEFSYEDLSLNFNVEI